METIYVCEKGDATNREHWELRLDGDKLLFFGQGGAKFMPAALPWHVQGSCLKGVAHDVKVAGEFAAKLVQHVKAGGCIEVDLDWYWNPNGTVGLRQNEPLPEVG